MGASMVRLLQPINQPNAVVDKQPLPFPGVMGRLKDAMNLIYHSLTPAAIMVVMTPASLNPFAVSNVVSGVPKLVWSRARR
jgi:hypothetical protein